MREHNYAYIFGGAIGDALLGAHLGRSLAEAQPGARLTLITTRENPFLRDLLKPLTFVRLLEMPKGRLRSWAMLPFFRAYHLVFSEPLSAPIPLWWRILARALTARPGSVEVHCVGKSDTVLFPCAKSIVYDCRTDNVFDLPPKILVAWGLPSVSLTPHLEASLYGPLEQVAERYLLFHFSAPSMRRSVPIAHAREILALVQSAFPAYDLVLTCTAADRLRTEKIGQGYSIRILEDLPAAALVRTIRNASAYVGVDTGVTHLSCHICTPCVVLGNRSNPCWLPYYAPKAEILFESRRCGCHGDKTGDCTEETPEGSVYRCLFDISAERVTHALHELLSIDRGVGK